jgi:hypothetical protein
MLSLIIVPFIVVYFLGISIEVYHPLLKLASGIMTPVAKAFLALPLYYLLFGYDYHLEPIAHFKSFNVILLKIGRPYYK